MGRFWKTLKILRQRVKTSHPVIVKVVQPRDAKDLYGDCDFDGKQYIIRIVKSDWDLMKLILIHEYAHCLTWNEERLHGPEWGMAHALCWEAYAGDIIPPVHSPIHT